MIPNEPEGWAHPDRAVRALPGARPGCSGPTPGRPGARAAAGRGHHRRPGRGRRGVHRAVDRAAGQGAGPVRRRGAARGRTAGWAASGRNGGFCSASLTHGLANGLERFGPEMPVLDRLGRENLDEIADRSRARDRLRLRAHRRAGRRDPALAPARPGPAAAAAARRVRGARRAAGAAGRGGGPGRDRLAGVLRRAVGPRRVRHRGPGPAGLGPAPGLPGRRRADLRADPGRRDPAEGPGLRLSAPRGSVRAPRAALGTGAYAPLLRRLRLYLVPVYDYAMMTEPLSAAQRASIGWRNRQGVGDLGNQFHYYRLTGDGRILWGGYDAVYYNGGLITSGQDQRPATFARLARHFFQTFPQLEGLRFTHTWGGVIDTCARFCVFFGTAHRGRVAYAAGYTGLGVGASRFGGNVLLDLLSGQRTERTELGMVRGKPVPFPPEPLRSAVIQLTRASLARADRHEGRRDLWLRTLDGLGLGFDS